MIDLEAEIETVVLISVDTLRADCLRASLDKRYAREYKVKTELNPTFLDEIVSGGAFFSNVISAAPYTSASHAAYFSGKWPRNNGIFDQYNSKLGARSIFEEAQENGYRTIFKTDFPLVLGSYLGLNRGVDSYHIEDEDSALHELEQSKKAFAFFHFGQVHYPYGFHNLKYGGRDYVEKIEALENQWQVTPESAALEDMAVESFRTEEDLKLLLRYKSVVSHLYKHGHDDALFNLYLEGINRFHATLFDDFLKKLLRTLQGRRYLVVIFGDHGEAWNDRCYGHHNGLEDGVLRVPMIFFGTEIKSKTINERVRSIDLAPTLAEMLHFETFACDGESLRGAICNDEQLRDRDAFASVWITEMPDLLVNVREALGGSVASSLHAVPARYGACYYHDQYKLEIREKFFLSRTEKLETKYERHEWLLSNGTNRSIKIPPEISSRMQREMNALNNIPAVAAHPAASEGLRRYFSALGYRV